jgi:hypothetical protein
MLRFFLVLPFLLSSCNSLRKATAIAEEEHNALYKQKALIIFEVKGNKVFLTNPTHTRCYFLRGSLYADKWSEGDTLVIDSNLADFYDLHYCRCQ